MADDQERKGSVGGQGNKVHPAPPSYEGNPPYQGQQPYGGQPGYGSQHGYGGQSHYPGQPYYPGSGYPPPQSGQQSQQSNSTVVVTQQPYATNTVIAASVPDNMGLAIFSCLCCFWPLGAFAIYKAYMSQNDFTRGDIEGAAKNGRDARLFSLISIGVGIASIVLIIIIVVSVTVTAANRRLDYTYTYYG